MPATDTFIGRHREIDLLLNALNDARRASGGLALIAGEPGIGKTRIVSELAEHQAGQDVMTLWGRCHEDDGAPPYWPWVQVLRSAAASIQADADLRDALDIGGADILELVPALRSRLHDIEPPTALSDPAQTRFRLFGSVARFLINASQRSPLVIVLDDLHWADVPSLRLLEHLAQELAESRILLIGTYRDTDLSRRHRLSDTLGALARTPRLLRVHLTGLGAEDVNHFIAVAAGVTPPEWLARAIHDQTEGNPLFVREVTRLLHEQGYFTDRPITGRISLPEGVREVIGRRLNLLSIECNETLAVAAVIGRVFALDVLMRASTPLREDTILERLDEALAARIIEEADHGQYQFTHTLVRTTLYDELRVGQRRRMHHTVAEAIEALSARDPGPVLADLAHHYRASGLGADVERAREYAIRAGDHADAAFAFEQAVGFYLNALDLVEDETQRCDLLLRMGNAQRQADDRDGSLTNLEAAATLARTLHDVRRFADAALSYADATWRFDTQIDSQANQFLTDALAMIPETDIAMRAKLLGSYARGLVHAARHDEAREVARQAIGAARASGDTTALIYALNGRSDLPWQPDEAADMLAEVEAMIAAASHVGVMEFLTRARLRRVPLLFSLGRVAEVEPELDGIARLNARMRQPLFMLMELVLRSSPALARGQLAEAERAIMATRDRHLAGPQTTDPVSLVTFALLRERDRLRDFAPVVSVFLARNPAMALWAPGLALLHVELGDVAEARRVFIEEVDKYFHIEPGDARLPANLVFLTEVCAALQDAARAPRLYEHMLPWTGHHMTTGSGTALWGACDRYLGLLATLMGDFDRAEAHFREAIAMNARGGLLLQKGYAQRDLAWMLLRRGRTGDRDRARQALDDAAELATGYGLTALSRRVAELRWTDDAPTLPDNLTPRELDVLRLIAIGRNNADIALVLGIGQSTVATHVHNILTKTGCANRTEAAAYARHQGIVETR